MMAVTFSVKRMSEVKSVELSVSSWGTLETCQTKYWHRKVAETPVDPDHEEGDSLTFGKAFHKVLESTLHTSYNDKLIIAAMTEFNVDRFARPMMTAMLDNYVKVHKASGLKVVKCEFELHIPGLYKGYIDFIAQDSHGWWLGDNKTASSHKPDDLVARLHKDRQINLYSYFAEEVGRALGMKGPFLGFRYRQSIKTKNTTPAGLAKGTPTYDIIIPADSLDPAAAWEDFKDAQKVAVEIKNGIAPRKNLKACFEYFKACEYFSSCHGCLASEGNPKITIHTLESLSNAELLG